MKVNYYSTIPPPVIPGTEAVMKEIDLLKGEFGGDFLNLYPFRRYLPGFPKILTGIQCVSTLRAMDRECDIHHVFLHHLFALPVLRILKKPVVCTITTTTSIPGFMSNPRYHIVINSERDAEHLRSKGFDRFSVIKPGIDTSRIAGGVFPYKGSDFILFSGSAPWIPDHFRRKGFDLLLDLVEKMPDLRLVCLWRGVLYEEFLQKIKDAGVQDRVEVINRKADPDEVLSRVHAGIVLADSPGVAAAYPLSLIESLVAGKPAITSGCLSISDYIRSHRCGCVVESFTSDDLRRCLHNLMAGYSSMAENARGRGRMDFSKEGMIESYHRLYSSLVQG
jgi:glycosyltransferase involved in cell wall biosynthesis